MYYIVAFTAQTRLRATDKARSSKAPGQVTVLFYHHYQLLTSLQQCAPIHSKLYFL